ncbi:MAG: hypothetical protein AB3N23_17925 [Paracoccaceae bacterium]
MKTSAFALVAITALSACSALQGPAFLSRSANTPNFAPTDVDSIVLTPGAFDPRRYESLGDLTVAATKPTVFSPEPTVADVEQRLREEAAARGATRVVEVQITDMQRSPVSDGSRIGRGIAVRRK